MICFCPACLLSAAGENLPISTCQQIKSSATLYKPSACLPDCYCEWFVVCLSALLPSCFCLIFFLVCLKPVSMSHLTNEPNPARTLKPSKPEPSLFYQPTFTHRTFIKSFFQLLLDSGSASAHVTVQYKHKRQ